MIFITKADEETISKKYLPIKMRVDLENENLLAISGKVAN